MTPRRAQAHCLPILILIALLTAPLTSASSSCPRQCACREEERNDLGTVFSVLCTNERLEEIPDLTFLTSVFTDQRVSVQNNEIKAVHANTFPPNTKIVALNLGNNPDLTFKKNALLPIVSTLKKLSFSATGLTFHDELKMLRGMQMLEDLNLSHNNRKGYVPGAVEHVSRVLFNSQVGRTLKKLDMSYCGVTTLSSNSRSLDSLVALEELNLANNWFTSVPPGISRLMTLKILQLAQCKITKLKDYDFQGLRNLVELDLSSNEIESVSKDAFVGLKDSLKKLKLSRCNLKEVPTEALNSLAKLTYLDLSENKFKLLPAESFRGLYCLNELLISAPEMEFEADSFKGQEMCIERLSLERMGLTAVPTKSLSSLKVLRALRLDGNNIESLPENAFEGLKASSISLANNPLKTVAQGAFSGLRENVAINLRRTKVTDIDFLTGYDVNAIGSVNLDYVDMACRCSMKSYLNVTENMQIFGSCKRNLNTVHFNKDQLEGVLEAACQEERGNSGARRISTQWRNHGLALAFVMLSIDCLTRNTGGMAFLTS